MEAMMSELCCSRLLPSSAKIVRHRPCRTLRVCRRPRTAAAGGSSCSNNVSQEQREVLVADLASSILSDLESFKLELRRSPPRICTLRAFAKEEQVPASRSSPDSVFFKPLAASVQATAQARKFETLSGRFSMIAFATALALEYVTGNSLFNNIDPKQLADFLVLLVTSLLTITSFAAAWLAKKEISLYMTRGCKDILDSALNDIVDGLFYDEDNGDGYEA